MAITAVGSIALDTITTSSGTSREVLGGSLTYFSFAASLFVPVHLIGVIGEDFPAPYFAWLQARAVQLEGLVRGPGKTFRWCGRYSDDFSTRVTTALELNVFEGFRPQLPQAARSQPYLFLGNIDPELQQRVLEQMTRPAFVVSDTIDYWIVHKPDTLRELFPHIHVFLINDEEARLLANVPDEIAAARWLIREGLDCVIIKRGAHGCVLATTRGLVHVPAFRVDGIADPTGAGDSFAGGLLGHMAQQRESQHNGALIDAIRYGAAAASFCVESVGVDCVRRMTCDDVEQRVTRLRGIPIETMERCP